MADRSRLRRIASRVLLGGGVVLGLALTGAVGVAVWLGTGGGNRWLEGQVETRGSALTDGGHLEIGSLDLDPFTGVHLEDVVLRGTDGRPLVQVGQLVADLDLWPLLEGRVVLPRARASDVRVDMTADEGGEIDLVRLFGPPGPPSDEPFTLPVDLDLPDVELEGVQVRYSTPSGPVVQASGLRATAAFWGRGDHLTLDEVLLSGQLAVPGPVTLVASGRVDYDGVDGLELDGVSVRIPHGAVAVSGSVGENVDLGIQIDELAALALDPFIGGALIAGEWTGSAVAKGPLSDLVVTATVSGVGQSRGELAATARLDLRDPALPWSGSLDVSHFHVEDLLPSLGGELDLDGVIDLRGQGMSYPDGLVVDGTWKGSEQAIYGQRVDAVDASFGLRNGVLELKPTRVEGIVGSLLLSGEIDLVRGPMAIDVEGELSPEKLAELGAAGLDGRGSVVATLSGDLQGDGRIVVDGTVRYAPFRYGTDIRMDRLTAAFRAVVDGGDVRGASDLFGSGVLAYGGTAASLSSRDLSFSVPSEGPISVGGTFSAAQLDYAALVGSDQAVAEVQVLVQGDDTSVQALVGLTDYQVAGRPGTDGTATVAMYGDDVSFGVVLRDYGHVVLDTRGTFAVPAARLDVRQLAWSPTPRSMWTLDGPAHLTVVEGGAADVRLVVGSNLGRVSVTGDLRTEGALDAHIGVEGLQLDLLAELYPDQLDGLSGVLDLGLQLEGTGEAPVIDGLVTAEGLYLDGAMRYVDARGGFRVADGGLEPAVHLDVAGEPFAMVTGRIPLSGGLSSPTPDLDAEARLSVAVVPGSFQRLKNLSPSLDEQALPAGRLSAVLEATGPLRDPELHLAGIAETDVQGWREPGRIEWDLRRQASELVWRTDLRQGLRKRATVDGTGATRLGEVFAWALDGAEEPDLSDLELYLAGMDVAAVLLGVPVASLAELGESPISLDGELVGGFVVTGSPLRPKAEGAVNWLDPKIGGEKLQGAYASILAADSGYDLQTNLAFDDGGGFDVSGRIPVVVDLDREWQTWGTGELDLTVGGGGVPLSVLAALDPEIRSTEGRLIVDAHIRGTLAEPEPEYALSVTDGRLTYRRYGLSIEDIAFSLEGDSRRVRLEQLQFRSVPSRKFQAGALEQADPRISVVGSANLADWKPEKLMARVSLKDGPWVVATEDTVARVDGDLTASGSWPELAIGGDLEFVYGRVALDVAEFIDAAPLEVDPRLDIQRGTLRKEKVAAVEEPPLYADFDVDVNVDLKRNLELALTMPFVDDLGALGAAVSRVDLSTRLGGDVQVAMNNGQPGVVGEVDLLEGKVRVLRSSFELTDGSISFTGGDPYENALLDINAEMVLSSATLDMSIKGTPTSPEIDFRSEQYPDKTQQMTMLLTGRAPDDLSVQEGAGAADALAGLLFQSIFAGQSLGTFSIEPDGAVRLGVPVSQAVYLASTLSPTNTSPTENTVSAEAEWTVVPHVVAAAGVGDRIQWMDVFWEVRF